MCSLFLVVCMSTYDKIKSCNQQIEHIYPIFIHLLYLNTDLKGYFLFGILVRIHGIRQTSNKSTGLDLATQQEASRGASLVVIDGLLPNRGCGFCLCTP